MRPRLFPRDFGLALRMVLAAVVTPLVVVAGLAAIVALAPAKVTVFVGIALVVGVFMAVGDRERVRSAAGHAPAPPALEATVARLCLAADLAKPEVVVSSERQPNSWVVWT